MGCPHALTNDMYFLGEQWCLLFVLAEETLLTTTLKHLVMSPVIATITKDLWAAAQDVLKSSSLRAERAGR